jgi:hypothetical protein
MRELQTYRKKMVADFGDSPLELERAYRAASSFDPGTLPGQRTPRQVLAELLYVEVNIFGPRLHKILQEDQPEFELIEVDPLVDVDIPEEDLIEAYRRQREEEFKWIQQMPPDGWNRTARHPWFGIRTFQWWVENSLLYSCRHVEELYSGA